MKTVLFDFDKTLTKRDTLRPLAHHFAKQHPKYTIGLILLYFALLMARFRIMEDKSMKEFFLCLFIKGKDIARVNSEMMKFFDLHLESLLNRQVFDALVHHRDNGDKIFIVSANFDFLLEPLIHHWGIKGIICTETEKRDGRYVGKIVGKTCKGKVKVERIKAIFPPQDIAEMIAFGDADDSEMLEMVGEAVLI